MHINPFAFIGHKDYENYMEDQGSLLTKQKNDDPESFNQLISSIEESYDFAFDDILDTLIEYLTTNGWIDENGNVMSVPDSNDITHEDFSTIADEIVLMLQTAQDNSLVITIDSLAEYGITWDSITLDSDESVDSADSSSSSETETLVAAGYYNGLTANEKAVTDEYNSFMFFVLKTSLQMFGRMNKKNYDKKKARKIESTKQERELEAKQRQAIQEFNAMLERNKKGKNKQKKDSKGA